MLGSGTSIPGVSQRPRASLGRVLDDLGDTLLELLAGDPAHDGEIGGVVIHDPDDEPVHPAGAGAALQSCLLDAVLLHERFRGGCPFGAAGPGARKLSRAR